MRDEASEVSFLPSKIMIFTKESNYQQHHVSYHILIMLLVILEYTWTILPKYINFHLKIMWFMIKIWCFRLNPENTDWIWYDSWSCFIIIIWYRLKIGHVRYGRLMTKSIKGAWFERQPLCLTFAFVWTARNPRDDPLAETGSSKAPVHHPTTPEAYEILRSQPHEDPFGKRCVMKLQRYHFYLQK